MDFFGFDFCLFFTKTSFMVYLLLAFTVFSALERFIMEILQIIFHRPRIILNNSEDKRFQSNAIGVRVVD